MVCPKYTLPVNNIQEGDYHFCEGIFKSPDPEQAYAKFYKRLGALKRETYGIGWGYGDAVQEILDDLEARFEAR